MEKTNEYNKLIAKFMGYEYYHSGVDIDDSLEGGFYERHEIYSKVQIETVEYPDDDQYYFKDGWHSENYDKILYNGLKYHESWDWLMPVIDKVESLGYFVNNNTNDWFDDDGDDPTYEVDKSRLQYVCYVTRRYQMVINSSNEVGRTDRLLSTFTAIGMLLKKRDEK